MSDEAATRYPRLSDLDWARLEDGHNLNDSLLDLFLKVLTQTLGGSRVHCFSTQFFSRLISQSAADGHAGWKHVKTWTKQARKASPVGIFAFDALLLPLHHEEEEHWSLAVISRPWACTILARDDIQALGSDKAAKSPQCVVTFFDSLGRDKAMEEKVLHYMRGYLSEEWTDCSGLGEDFDIEKVVLGEVEELPGQSNENDCGVFVLEYAFQLMWNSQLLFQDLVSRTINCTDFPKLLAGASPRKRWRLAGTLLRRALAAGDLSKGWLQPLCDNPSTE